MQTGSAFGDFGLDRSGLASMCRAGCKGQAVLHVSAAPHFQKLNWSSERSSFENIKVQNPPGKIPRASCRPGTKVPRHRNRGTLVGEWPRVGRWLVRAGTSWRDVSGTGPAGRCPISRFGHLMRPHPKRRLVCPRAAHAVLLAGSVMGRWICFDLNR